VLDQRMRFVLRHHLDAADARVDAIGEHEIDDAKLAAERRGWLCSKIGEMFQPFAATAGHDDSQRIARQTAHVAPGRSLSWAQTCI